MNRSASDSSKRHPENPIQAHIALIGTSITTTPQTVNESSELNFYRMIQKEIPKLPTAGLKLPPGSR